ncbi:glycosyltransferase [Georgenia satyanarayanai]|uniref:glycosyltransferase n=1 Tax=Georgenia satyanarayanai TaxID=860221 RepID=UPI00203BDCC5|nr:glycosyltransferase [Georgenia satyanarayanai]MCM3661052.1 glycosyltransferase [Georgenia satyanarayanai]
MRVLQVSAHFPPNFVSGGTLVPYRVARAVAAAGHESLVYAGHLDAQREPLSTWTDDDDGVPVRWVTTTPWTGWSDPRNSHNPEVEADFRRWLEQTRPDVVHLHSVQTLGGSLVRAAKDAGAAVVVTMHDFWWFCARQFLVTRDMRPCSLVVGCGTCPCEVDHDWLVRRDAALAEHLAAADVVLAPSRSAARVLVANGVDPHRVRVDENGLPALQQPTQGRQRADHVRFLFAGGNDPMKGAAVLREALGALANLPGWTIDLYGVTDTAGLPEAASARPAYRPADLGDVLARHDVLVLPSIMRESHSILTREALSAGLAVICTDTLGPEEAVADGVNGLVVPAADSEALAAAMRRTVTEPGLADRIIGAGALTPPRDFADQAAGLLELYAEVAGRAASDVTPAASGGPADAVAAQPDGTDVPAGRMIGRVLFIVGIQGAPLRYRAQLPAEGLRLLGVQTDVRHYRDPQLSEAIAAADAVVLYRVPATWQVLALLDELRAQRPTVPVVYDIDDLVFDPRLRGQVDGLTSLAPEEEELWWRGVARYRTTMERADLYIGSTRMLCEQATDVAGLPARHVANGVGALLAQASDDALQRPRTSGPLRIGYFSGTTTHDADWALVEPAVLEVLEARPDVELWLGGHLRPTAALARVSHRVRRLPFVPWYELPLLLRDVDVCLAPLTSSRFNEAKSAIKWLEAALVETPVVATATEPFRDAVDDGRTGYLAESREDWVRALGALLDDPVLRRRVGTQARRAALLRWSPHLQGRAYLAALGAAAEHVALNGPRQPTAWDPVADDEPLSAMDAYVEPYVRPARRPGVVSRLARSAPGRRFQAVLRVYRAGGAGAVRERVAARLRAGRR